MLATKPSINENIVNSSTLNVKDTNSARCNIKDSGNGCESKSTFSSLLGNNNDCLTYLQKSVNSTNANRTTSLTTAPNTTTFDYLYEFSETRKVLEDFFKCPNNDEDKKMVDCFNESDTGSYVSFSSIIFQRFGLGMLNFSSYLIFEISNRKISMKLKRKVRTTIILANDWQKLHRLVTKKSIHRLIIHRDHITLVKITPITNRFVCISMNFV